MINLLLSLFAGIAFAFALISFFILSKNRKQVIYRYFGLFSLFSGLYFLSIVLSAKFELNLHPLSIICAAIYYGIFPWFVFEFIGLKKKPVLWFQSSFFVLAAIVYLINPSVSKFSIWQIIAHIGLVFLMITAIYGAVVLFREKKKSAVEFTLLTSIFVFLAIEEMLNNYLGFSLISGKTGSFLPLDIYPLLFSIVMGRLLSEEIWTKNSLNIKVMKAELLSKELEIKKLEKEQLEERLLLKNIDLVDFGVEITRKNEFAQSVLDQLNELKKSLPDERGRFDELIRFVRMQNKIDSHQARIQKNANIVNQEYLAILKKTYPSLTANEIHLASLLRLKLSSKEIAAIKHITPESVKVLRHRLRKKLEVPEKTRLTDFLLQIN